MPEQALIETFGPGPLILARAPGRVNLIGEHTDYTGGFVFPMAIDRDLRVACRPVEGRRVTLLGLDAGERHEFDLDRIRQADAPQWARYFMGVAHVLQTEGHRLRAVHAAVRGDVPVGAGLSSSAAMEVASAMALCAASEVHLHREKLAVLCQRAENEFVGVNCGIMDQFASLLSRQGHALFIDCANLSSDTVPFDDGAARVIVCDTGVKRALLDSAYNTRRQECAAALKVLQRRLPGIRTYRDIHPAMLSTQGDALPDPLNRRARHVVTENARVLYAVQALKRSDLIAFGALMDASHESLKNDYEVSCPELDLLVALARDHHGTYGARMTGAGFGGCTVALVRPDTAKTFIESVSAGYARETGRPPEVYVFRPSEGATVEFKK